MTRRAPLGVRVLDRPHCGRPRQVRLAGEVERAGTPGQRGDEDVVRFFVRELDRAPSRPDGLADVASHRRCAHGARTGLDIGSEPVGPLAPRSLDESEEPTSLDLLAIGDQRAGRRRGSHLGPVDELLVGE